MIEATPRERALSAFGTALVLGGFGYALLAGLGMTPERIRRQAEAILALQFPDPPVPPPVTFVRPRSPAHQPKPEASSPTSPAPARLLSPPTPAVIPIVSLPAPPTAAAGGAAGSGSGTGSGNGDGADGSGDGTGGGGDAETEPRQIRGKLKFSDLPEQLRAAGVGGSVSVRYEVEADGHVGACTPIGSSGNEELDRRTCELIQQRFRFAPARDADGRPVAATIEEAHSWERLADIEDRSAGR